MVFGAARAHNSHAIKWVLLCNLDSLDKEELLIQSQSAWDACSCMRQTID